MVRPELDTPEKLRADLLQHFADLGLSNLTDGASTGDRALPATLTLDKEGIRAAHSLQRQHYLAREAQMSGRYWARAMTYFADGDQVDPARINPILVPVSSGTFHGELFRFATTLWSVPVSRGYGRRMRYLVFDQQNGKLMGLFALGDPVFNLKVRDTRIGWNQADRRERLVNVMDGYVIGSVPPYSALLGGKLVTSLIGSSEVADDFRRKYGEYTGIISKSQKEARLTLVTVTSALGRSSIYNRLNLRDHETQESLVRLERIGSTEGYGHFHLSEDLFSRMRYMLLMQDHRYALAHQFGDGPNWRFRLIRAALEQLELSPHLIRHGISREVFAMPLAGNFENVLKEGKRPYRAARPSVAQITEAALAQWVIPRATSRPEYVALRSADFLAEQSKLLQNGAVQT